MISDVIVEAISRVNWYLREHPTVYRDDPAISEQVDRTLIAMQALLSLLDKAPTADEELAAENPQRN